MKYLSLFSGIGGEEISLTLLRPLGLTKMTMPQCFCTAKHTDKECNEKIKEEIKSKNEKVQSMLGLMDILNDLYQYETRKFIANNQEFLIIKISK